MASASVPMVHAEANVSVVIPTLGRESLAATRVSLETQTLKPIVIVKNSPGDTLIKIKEAVNESDAELIAIADDDAVYPNDWIQNLAQAFAPQVGFVGGPCLPLLNESSTSAEKAIAEVTTNWFGTSNMSYRMKVKGKVREADETNLIGSGMYRRKVLEKILDEEYDRIPPAAWETYVFTRIRQLGFKTLYNPKGFFYHKPRSNIFSFAKQIFRCGMGRMNFFKQFPSSLATKFYMLIPPLFVAYLILFFSLALVNLPISGIPLILYVAAIMLIGYGPKHSSRFQPLYFFTLHSAYGLGMLYGLVRNDRTWT